jgi:hypothetical protein
MTNPKLAALQVYLAHAESMVKSTTIQAKREFFQREVRKTLFKINELTK